MSADVVRARAELGSVREDLDELTRLAGEVAIATRDSCAVDHETSVELCAAVAAAIGALETVQACLADDAESESEVAS